MSVKTALFGILLTAVLFSCGRSDGDNSDNQEQRSEITPSEERIYLEMDMAQLEGAKAGDEVFVALENGDAYTLIIQRAEETMPGLTSIAANIGDMETGQAALIYRDSTLRGSVDMYAQGLSFQLNYDSETGKHYLTPRMIDELEGGEPLTPPDSRN